jgi:hypothetical protein
MCYDADDFPPGDPFCAQCGTPCDADERIPCPACGAHERMRYGLPAAEVRDVVAQITGTAELRLGAGSVTVEVRPTTTSHLAFCLGTLCNAIDSLESELDDGKHCVVLTSRLSDARATVRRAREWFGDFEV